MLDSTWQPLHDQHSLHASRDAKFLPSSLSRCTLAMAATTKVVRGSVVRTTRAIFQLLEKAMINRAMKVVKLERKTNTLSPIPDCIFSISLCVFVCMRERERERGGGGGREGDRIVIIASREDTQSLWKTK